MATTLRTLPAAPPVRREVTTRYTETLTPNGWERISTRTRSRRYPTAPTVRVIRRETVYREPIGTRGEKSHVRFTIIGTRAADYVRECLPTIQLVPAASDNEQVFGVWYY